MLIGLSGHTFTFLKEKLIATIIPASLLTLTLPEYELIKMICWMVVIDTVLGARVAMKHKKFSSTKFSRVIGKLMIYSVTMLIALLISNLDIPYIEFFFNYTGAFIVITEAFSCFEKIGYLGYPSPKRLLMNINDDFARWCDGDEEMKERVLNRHDYVNK